MTFTLPTIRKRVAMKKESGCMKDCWKCPSVSLMTAAHGHVNFTAAFPVLSASIEILLRILCAIYATCMCKINFAWMSFLMYLLYLILYRISWPNVQISSYSHVVKFAVPFNNQPLKHLSWNALLLFKELKDSFCV